MTAEVGLKASFSRFLAAPRALVWKAWTDPRLLANWWGPAGFSNPRCEFELREGAALHMDMRAPDGTIYPMGGVVREFIAPERLVFTAIALDAAGAAMFENLNILTLTEQDGGTLLELKVEVIAIHDPAAAGHLQGMEQGWSLSLERLSNLVTSPRADLGSFTLERFFPVPVARVFAAFSTEAGKQAWFSGTAGQWEAIRREFDFRVGGHERLVGKWASGMVTDFDAYYHDIVPDRRIVYSYSMYMNERKLSVSLATLEFYPEGPGTRMILSEQGAFLDGYDDAGSRERGTADLLEKVAASLGC